VTKQLFHRIYSGDPAPVQPLAAWGTAEAPPEEFLIFRYGPNHATIAGRREIVTLTQKGAVAIVKEWRRRNISGAFDYEHAVADAAARAKGAPAAGWFNVEARTDGLWAVGISWTEAALAYFAAKEYRYFSPYFMTNGKNEIVLLVNVALTNWPATDQQRPLIALSTRALRRHTTMEPLSLEQLKAKAQELMDTFGAKGELMDIAAWLDKLTRGEGAPAAPEGEMPAGEEAMTADPIAEELTAVAEAAFSATGLRQPREAIGALRQFGAIVKERNAAVTELRQVKHSQFVDQCLAEGKITPANKAKALAEDPATFRGAMTWAQPVIDVEALTARTNTTTQGAAPTVEELEKDEKLIAYCNKQNLDVKLYAQNYARLGTKFEA